MLAKKYRLSIQSMIKKSGQIIKGRYFLLKIFDNGLEHNRFGVIINKKVSPKATNRNKIKRLIFDSVGEFLLAGKEKKDFLMIVLPRIMEAKPEEVKKEIDNLISNSQFPIPNKKFNTR